MPESVTVLVSVGTDRGFATRSIQVPREGPVDFWERLHQLAGREAVSALRQIEHVSSA